MDDVPSSSGRRFGNAALGLMATVAFWFFFHNYGITLFPFKHRVMEPAKMSVLVPGKFAYVYPFSDSEPDLPLNWRDRAELLEKGKPSIEHRDILEEVILAGGGRWVHEPGRIVFSTTDNTDPRSNGRTYELAWPLFYRRIFGRLSALVLGLSLLGLYGLNRRRFRSVEAAPPPEAGRSPSRHWRWHLWGACLLFLAGLYCNTGTLSPYAITTFPYADKTTGYLYNPDHVHFKVLFAFVNNAHRSVWNHALLLRRILFPALGWPLMRIFGFEIGGTLASLALNTAALMGFLLWLRRRVGARGAIFAAWLLALSPGAAYWGGLPYPYALIFPGSLLLFASLCELGEVTSGRAVAWLSLGMGVIYLGHDLAVFFVPASVILLLGRRRFLPLLISVPIQLLPLGIWLFILKFGLKQSLENSNAGIYHAVLSAYVSGGGLAHWGASLARAFDAGWNAYFGANFIFLPALFLVLVGLNPLTSRVRFKLAEVALLAVTLALFLFDNLSPDYGGWDMHGSWISRIYQPMFPVFILFAARWWQHLPKLRPWGKGCIGGLILLTLAGNALIVFGPITLNPLKLSEFAYYRFYNHNGAHWVYEYNLRQFGRRPLGFPRPQP